MASAISPEPLPRKLTGHAACVCSGCSGTPTPRSGTPTPRSGTSVARLALSPDEAAAALGCSRTFFDEHVAAGLRMARVGRRRFVPVRELERWLDGQAARAVKGR